MRMSLVGVFPACLQRGYDGGQELKTPTGKYLSMISPRKNSLGVIVRTFKGAVTTELRREGKFKNRSPWQRNYFEHIIRDDASHFFIQQYIELNPLLWHLDQDNLDVHDVPMQSLQHELAYRYGLRDNALAYVRQLEEEYRTWKTYVEQIPRPYFSPTLEET